MLLCTSSNLGVLLVEDAYDSCGYFTMDDSLVVFADDVGTKFLVFFFQYTDRKETTNVAG